MLNIVSIGAPDGTKSSIADGTKWITVIGRVGQMISEASIDIVSGITNSYEEYGDFDAYSRPRKVTYIDGTYTWTDYGCCGPTVVTNREGMVITYYRDPLKFQAATKQNGITVTNILDSKGRVLKTIRIGSDGSQIVQASYGYDTLGNQIAYTNALGFQTATFEGITNYQRTVTATYPDGSTRGQTYYRDGQLAKVTGTGVHPVRYDYGTEQDGGVWRLYSKEIKLDNAGNDTSEWTKSYRDMLGRGYKTVYSDGASRQSFYNTKGQLVKETDPDGVTTLYAYNAKGERSTRASDVDRNGLIDTSGTDRILQTVQTVTVSGSVNVQRTASYVWSTNSSGVSNLVATTDTSVDGLRTWQGRFGVTNQTWTKYAGSGNRYVTNTAADGSGTVSYYANSLLQSVTRKDPSGVQLSQTSYTYDAHGRQYAVTDARNGSTLYSFDNADRVTSLLTPPPGNGQPAQSTSYS